MKTQVHSDSALCFSFLLGRIANIASCPQTQNTTANVNLHPPSDPN